MNRFLLTLLSIITLFACQQERKSSLRLWYTKPAQEWTEALPLGNGRIGAMVFGGVSEDRIQFNEETLWTGKPRDYSREGASAYLGEIRQLLFDGKQGEAEKLAGMHFMGRRSNEEDYPDQKEVWLQKVRAEENLIYKSIDFDDSQWETMTVPAKNGWEEIGFDGIDGAGWFRFTFDLPADWSGKELVLELGKIRETDFTYFNGEFLGSETNRNIPRVYSIPNKLLKSGKNVIAVQIVNFQNKGGFVGFKDFEELMKIYPSGTDRNDGITLSGDWKFFWQDLNPPAFPEYQESYQPFGDLIFNISNHENAINYQRTLDINRAIATTTYEVDGVKFQREYFISAADQCLAVRFTASEKQKINLQAALSSPHRATSFEKVDFKTIKMTSPVQNGALRGVSYVRAEVNKGGGVEASKDGFFIISDADEVTFYLTAATNYVNFQDATGNPEQKALIDLKKLDSKTFDQIKEDHISDYQALFNRFEIQLGEGNGDTIPTDQRMINFTQTEDPSFVALYVQFGRYLMISTSREGTRPPNLQGIWNEDITPPWGSKYTTNINLEMNYWPVDLLNLSDCFSPLIELTKDVAKSGKLTAKNHYDAEGWVLHHNTDIWRGTAPINNANHGIWVTGGAWLCESLWDHFLFTRDTSYLNEEAYPLMFESASFFSQFLVKDPSGKYLISTPSNSPEHGGLVAGPAMDHQIIRNLYQNCLEAEKVLGLKSDLNTHISEQLKELAPNQIGRYGQLQEWLADVDDPENKHRHVSHLWAVYPGSEISGKTPELLDAARKSLEMRGDEGTGWSLAWKINLWARFGGGNHAWELVKTLLSPAWTDRAGRGGSYVNLFDAHPPFQIDGNFGAAAGVAELLVQSHLDYIEIFPALPDALATGEVKGLKLRGGFVLDMKWKNASIETVMIKGVSGQTIQLSYKGQLHSFKIPENEKLELDAQDFANG